MCPTQAKEHHAVAPPPTPHPVPPPVPASPVRTRPDGGTGAGRDAVAPDLTGARVTGACVTGTRTGGADVPAGTASDDGDRPRPGPHPGGSRGPAASGGGGQESDR
ncbi:hypothetical protein GCM10010206_15010 [Streptomyces cinerochromogenes]|nr:hypothetical protein GCM10010206_15010 [Streptomyces cinerochromogenes]